MYFNADTIHQIWLGRKPRPACLMDSWKRKNPLLDYRVWSDSDIKDFDLQDKIYSMETLSGKADIMRYEILLKYGGFYADADSYCMKSIFNLLDAPFVCYESEKHKPGLISNGYLFFPKNHPMMASICNHIETRQVSKASTGLDCWAVTGPKLVTRYLTKDVKILPSWYFIPTHYLDDASLIHEESYSIEYWHSTREKLLNGNYFRGT